MAWENVMVAGAAALFALFLLTRMAIPAFRGGTRPPVEGLAQALERVNGAEGPKAKAAELIAAGDLVAASGARVTSASGYYLRAMRLDSASLVPVERLAKLLRARPNALDRILWKRLAALPWDGETKLVAARAAELLGARTTRRRPERQVLTRLAQKLRALNRRACDRSECRARARPSGAEPATWERAKPRT